MGWILFYIAGGVVSLGIIYLFIKEFKKISKEKDDYDGGVNLPD